jgi:hypothetical protein
MARGVEAYIVGQGPEVLGQPEAGVDRVGGLQGEGQSNLRVILMKEPLAGVLLADKGGLR